MSRQDEADELVRLYNGLRKQRDELAKTWQFARWYLLPNRVDDLRFRPSDFVGRVRNGAARMACARLAGAHMSHIVTSHEPWFKWIARPGDVAEEDVEEANAWYGKCSDIALMELTRSNFYSEIYECFLDRVGMGTGSLYCGPGRSVRLLFKAISPEQVCGEVDDEGRVVVFVREMLLSAYDVADLFGKAALSEGMAADYHQGGAGMYEKKWVVLHVVRRAKKPKMGRGWESFYVDQQGKRVMRREMEWEMPYMATRWKMNGTSFFGFAPWQDVEGEVRGVEEIEKDLEKARRVAIDPRILTAAKLVGEVDLRAGGKTLVDPDLLQDGGVLLPKEWAAVGDGGRVLLCPCKNGVACAVYDPVAQSLTACTVTGSKKAVWHVMPLRDGRAVLLCGESAGDVADGEAAMGSVCLYEDGKVVEKMGSFLGLAGCVEREDGRVVLLYFGLGGWGEFVWDLEDGKTIESKVTVNGFWPRKWKWCGWRSGGMDMVNFLSGAVGRGVDQVWTAAEMGGMKWRVLRLSYKTYGGAGLPYERAVTDVWSRGMFGGGCGWPSAVAMHQGRLWLAGTAANPQTVWGSVVDDFANFQIGDSDEDAIQVTLAAKDCHRIVWMESVNDLLIGSTAQVWRLSGGEGGVVTPDFCRAAVQLRVGCSRVDAEATDGGCVFVQRGGMRVKELGYSFEADGYRAADTTTFAEHAGGPGGFVGLAVQRVPEVRIWGVRADGGLAVLTYNAEQRVCAWTRHVLGGGGRALSVAVMDGQDADEVWLAVERDGRVSLERLVEGCGVFRDGWSRGGDAGVPYESVLVTNGLAFEQGAGVKSGSVSVRARFVASAADGVRAGFCGRLTELSRSRGDVLDGWQDLTVPGVWSDELVFELRCAGDGDVRLLGFDVQFSK